MKVSYPIIAQENLDEDGHYYVAFSPNIPGMVTQADSLLALLDIAPDAIFTMLENENHPAVQDPKTWQLQANESVHYVVVDL